MRQMRDPVVGAAALGDVVDDVDQVTRFAFLVADGKTARGDVTLAQRLAVPGMLVLEQAVWRPQRCLVMRGDNLGGGPWEHVGRSLADNGLARLTEMRFGDPIDQYVTALAHVLHRDLRGNVIDDLAQKSLVA